MVTIDRGVKVAGLGLELLDVVWLVPVYLRQNGGTIG